MRFYCTKVEGVHLSTNSHRGVSLMPVFAKVFELLIDSPISEMHRYVYHITIIRQPIAISCAEAIFSFRIIYNLQCCEKVHMCLCNLQKVVCR